MLYELKSDLHVLYAGARVLGAMEDATVKHEGGHGALRRSRRSYARIAPQPICKTVVQLVCLTP